MSWLHHGPSKSQWQTSVFAATLIAVSVLIQNGTLTGRAIGGSGCTPAVDDSMSSTHPTAASDACAEQAIADHPDPLHVLQQHVFEPHCSTCHAPEGEHPTIDLSHMQSSYTSLVAAPSQRDTRRSEALVTPGDVQRSNILTVLQPHAGDDRAGDADDAHRVSALYYQLIARWIEEGAPRAETTVPPDLPPPCRE